MQIRTNGALTMETLIVTCPELLKEYGPMMLTSSLLERQNYSITCHSFSVFHIFCMSLFIEGSFKVFVRVVTLQF